jgi:fructose-1,6-bisphosphatase
MRFLLELEVKTRNPEKAMETVDKLMKIHKAERPCSINGVRYELHLIRNRKPKKL